MFSQYHVLERIGEGSFGKVPLSMARDFDTAVVASLSYLILIVQRVW